MRYRKFVLYGNALCNMYKISATEEKSDEKNSTFVVTAAKGDNEYEYEVVLPKAYYNSLARETHTEKEFIEASFRFLLANESPESILPTFEIPIIQTYFSNYESDVLTY